MRPNAPLPAGPALPLPSARSSNGHRRHLAGQVYLGGEDIARFNNLLHELHPDAPHLDADAVASVARWLIALPAPQAEAMLQARLARLEDLRDMLADRDWQADPALAQRIGKLVDYAAENDDLIPDQTPFVGRLDDALLVELAWPMVADELDDYRDFCRFREELGHLYGGHPDRDDWLRTRLEEGALWEQLHRIRESRYVDYGPGDEALRVV